MLLSLSSRPYNEGWNWLREDTYIRYGMLSPGLEENNHGGYIATERTD